MLDLEASDRFYTGLHVPSRTLHLAQHRLLRAAEGTPQMPRNADRDQPGTLHFEVDVLPLSAGWVLGLEFATPEVEGISWVFNFRIGPLAFGCHWHRRGKRNAINT